MIYEEKLIKVAQWRTNILTFLTDCFPHHFTKPFASFHKEIFDFVQSYPRVAMAAPRGHGKSEILTFGYVMWSLLCVPDRKFTIIISNNYANAVKYLVPIKEEIEHNEMLNDVFGPLKSEKWSENEAEFTHKNKITVGGNDFKIRGQKYLQYRPDLIIIDDPEDDELVRSDQRRDNFERWLLYGLEPAMTHTSLDKIVFIGTILHRASQLSKLMINEGKYKNWRSRKYMAINDNKALWQENIPLSLLERKKDEDPYKFAQEYMNNPVPFEHAMFKEEYFDNYDDSPRDLIVNITCDLACSDKSYSDFTVILACGVDSSGDLWVLEYKRGKYVDPDQIIEQIFGVYDKYKKSFGKLGIEKTSFQRFLIKNFDRERKKRGLRFPIYEISAKGDKTQRIAQLQPLFSSGDIHIKSYMLDLKQELLDFPRALHDDISDALAMQLELMDRKPVSKDNPDYKWKVTPDMQREKILAKMEPRGPRISNITVGV